MDKISELEQLNKDNVDLLLNNLFARMRKNLNVFEQKQVLDQLHDEFSESYQQFTSDFHKKESALLAKIEEEKKLLVDSQGSISYLERNYIDALAAVERHCESISFVEKIELGNDKEFLQSLEEIYQVNMAIDEKNRFQNNPDMYLKRGLLTNIKAKYFTDSPVSIVLLQKLVDTYPRKKMLAEDLNRFSNYLANLEELEQVSSEAEVKLNEKNEYLTSIQENLNSYSEDLAVVQRDIKEWNKNGFQQVVSHIEENSLRVIDKSFIENLSPIITKLKFSPIELESIVESGRKIQNDLQNMENVLQSDVEQLEANISSRDFYLKKKGQLNVRLA